MILAYTHTITSRVTYAMNLVFGTVLNIPYELTDNKKYFEDYTLPKIAYTTELNVVGIYIQSDTLLFEIDIKPTLPVADKSYIDFPKFFKSNTNDFLGYDIFAMVFYFATRYEEYLHTDTDEHQRFKAENSIAFQYDCLQSPFLNVAINQFSEKLKRQFPSLNFEKRKFNFLSTIDIDNAFAYANKGFKRNLGGLTKDIFSLKFNQIAKRLESIINSNKDPYNTFKLINSLSKQTQTALRYFVLIGDYSTYDKNPNYRNPGFTKLLKSLSSNYSIGLHPSYESFNHPEKIGIEKKRLEDIIEKKVTSARCHFLRVKFSQTYRTLIEQGIIDDYTMIYASQSGFRTGLCMPCKWFDLERNEQTNLTIHSSIIMEGTLRDYNKYSPAKANEVINQLLEETKKQGGEFVSVWHNDSFVTSQNEWIEVYKKLLNKSKSSNL
jgi:hypothetical protein